MQQSSVSKKRSLENGDFFSNDFPSKLKCRSKPRVVRDFPKNCGPSKPCVVRDLPRNCGPSKPNSGIHSPVKCRSMLESPLLEISVNSGPLASESSGGSIEGFNNMEKSKIVDNVTKEMADDIQNKLCSHEAMWELALEKVAEMIALDLNVNSRRVRGKNNIRLDMKWDDLGYESMETEGDGVGDENFLSRSVDGQNLNEMVPKKGGVHVNEKVQEQDNIGREMEWRDLGDDFYILSPRDAKLWQPCFEKRFGAKALMSENHVEADREGVDVVGSQRTKIIVLEENDSDGEVSVSGKNRKMFFDLDRYEGEKEQHESMDNFTIVDNLACVEFKDTCNDDGPKNHQTPNELVNLCMVKHDGPEGYKVRGVLLKFEERYEALKKERKVEMGEVRKGEIYSHIEVAKRLKAEGMCISVQKPFGHIPGIEIGDAFQFKAQLVVVGLHSRMMCGIDYVTIGDEKFATCVVDSGRYDNKAKTNDILTYSGQGGNPKVVDTIADQKLIKGNIAMVNSMKMGYPVRVVRKIMSGMTPYVFSPSKHSKYVYAYDGLYKVTKYWQERDQNGSLVFKFELTRMPNQPRPCQTLSNLN